MVRSNQKRNRGPIDGGEGRGVPLDGPDETPRAGYDIRDDEPELEQEDDDDLDRRRDPLRKP